MHVIYACMHQFAQSSARTAPSRALHLFGCIRLISNHGPRVQGKSMYCEGFQGFFLFRLGHFSISTPDFPDERDAEPKNSRMDAARLSIFLLRREQPNSATIPFSTGYDHLTVLRQPSRLSVSRVRSLDFTPHPLSCRKVCAD